MKLTKAILTIWLWGTVLLTSTLFSVYAYADGGNDLESSLLKTGLTLPGIFELNDDSISITFPENMGGITLTFEGALDPDKLADGTFEFSTSDGQGIKWENAFGMSFLDFDDVELSLSISKETFSSSLDAKLGGAFKNNGQDTEVVVDFAFEDKSLSDFSLSLPNTTIALSDIDDLGNIPGINTFSISDLAISLDAISGQIDFIQDSVKSLVFYDKDSESWLIAFNFDQAVTLADITGIKSGFMKDIALPAVSIATVSKDIDVAYEDLPLAAQAFYSAGGELPEGNLKLSNGVNISAGFDPSTTSDDVKSALSSIGLGETALDVDGSIENMFDGTPSLALAVDIDTPGDHGFKVLNIKDTQVEFFIELSEDSAEIGFRTAVFLSQSSGNDLEFDVDFGLKESDTNIEVQVAGSMKGDWKDVAGIKGVTLENPFMSMGINETGSFDTLIDGTVIVGSETVRGAIDIVLSPEALGLPTAFAIAGQVSNLDFNDLTHFASKRAKPKKGFKHMDVAFKDVAFAFMTPGATLPQDLADELKIEGSGIALKGSLYINDKEMASANGYASTEGLSIQGDIEPFHVGPLSLKEADLDIQVGPEVSPKFAMSGDMTIYKGFEEKYSIDLEPNHFSLSSETSFGKSFEADISIESDNLNFSEGGDINFSGELDANYTKLLQEGIKAGVKGLKKANSEISKKEQTVKDKKNKLNQIKDDIKKAKAEAQKSYDDAVKKIDDAQKKVDSLKKKISTNKKKAHDAHEKAEKDAKKIKLAQATKDKAEEAGYKSAETAEEASLKTANWALEQAKKTVKVVPVDAAPKVVSLEAKLKTEQAALDVAIDAMNAAKDVNKSVASALKSLDNVNVIKINSIGVSGSVEGMLSLGKKGTAPTLTIDVNINKVHHIYHVQVTNVSQEFKKLTETATKQIAKSLVDSFK